MRLQDLVNKEKVMCDNIMSLGIIIGFFLFFIFFRLLTFMALIVYPLSAAFIMGISHTYRSFFKETTRKRKILKFLQGASYLIFSGFWLWIIFSNPSIPPSYIVYFISVPTIFIGIAAILKGAIIDVYTIRFRIINIIVGAITIIFASFALYTAYNNYLISLISVIMLLMLNGISRSALYLSEYGLSVGKLKNIKYVFFIMDNFIVLNIPEDTEEKI